MQAKQRPSGIPKAVKRTRPPRTNARQDAGNETEHIGDEDVEPVEFTGARRDGVINPESSMDRTSPNGSERTNTPRRTVTFRPVDAVVDGDPNVPNIFTKCAMPCAILFFATCPSSMPESSPTNAAAPAKTIRLIIRRAYRNSTTGQLYAFAEGRRLIVIRKDAPLQTLKSDSRIDAKCREECREECTKALRMEGVLEMLTKENGFMVAVTQTQYLCNLDEIIAVTAAPPPPRRAFCCGDFWHGLNLGYPEHKPLLENPLDAENFHVVQRTYSRIAILIQKLNTTETVVEKGSQEIRKMSQGWARVSGRLLNSSRPFFVFPWAASLAADLQILIRMVGCSLSVGSLLACLPFNTNLEKRQHRLYAYLGMGILGFQTGLFVNAWIGYYFYIHMNAMSYLFSALLAPFISIALYFAVTAVAFPFYNTPVSVMLILTAFVYLMAYPHMPARLRHKSEVKQDVGNSLLILEFFMLVFVVNRLLVLNFGQRDTTSLMALSVIYPLLVSRSKTDCARMAEAFNRKSVAVVEAFFTFVSSVFQMIVFLSIDSKINPLYVFAVINSMDMISLTLSGPVASFFEKTNAEILRQHRETVDTDPFNQALSAFSKWVKDCFLLQDPFYLKPLLIKCYCEISAKTTFLIIALIIRWGPSNEAYPFIQDVDYVGFTAALRFTGIELCIWISILYLVELYLRRQRCQYLLQKEKKNMRCIANILGLINAFITTLLLLQQTPVSGA